MDGPLWWISCLNINSQTVDCKWDAWGNWSECAKKDAGSCGVPGDGKANRTRLQERAVANNGTDCEATSMEDDQNCCADGDTDSTACTDPSEVCLPGD